MKKSLLIAWMVIVPGLLIVGLAIPTFAHDSNDEVTPGDEAAWEAMHEACEEGDREAMTEAAERWHGDTFDHMPCYDESYYHDDHTHSYGRGGMGGHMGRGMMGW